MESISDKIFRCTTQQNFGLMGKYELTFILSHRGRGDPSLPTRVSGKRVRLPGAPGQFIAVPASLDGQVGLQKLIVGPFYVLEVIQSGLAERFVQAIA